MKRFLDRCATVHEKLHKPALTTDIIVGFPGETEEDFQASCDAARIANFSKIHAFPFSARKGTPAASMSNQISKQEKADRISRLSNVEAALRKEYFEGLVGDELTVLVESAHEDGTYSGTSCRYAPVKINGNGLQKGDLARVNIALVDDDAHLKGTASSIQNVT